MTLDTRTIVLVTGRIVDLMSRPRLFDDRMPASRLVLRMDRILAWLGATGRAIASDHVGRKIVPPPGVRRWKRGGCVPINDNR